MTTVDEVRRFYGSNVDFQWSRFDRFAPVEEYVLTKSLREHLPPAPARVLDVGGGNGRHALRLAALGYDVWLCDLTPELVADAARRSAEADAALGSIEVADARALSWPDGHGGAGLLLGPMYCLPAREDRARALSELHRVLRPGAPVFVQFLTRLAGLRSALEAAPSAAGLFDWRRFLDEGVFTDEHLPGFLRVHNFSSAAEAADEVSGAGFEIVDVREMDGPAPTFGQKNLGGAPDHVLEQWGEIAYLVGGRPEFAGAGNHLLVSARRS